MFRRKKDAEELSCGFEVKERVEKSDDPVAEYYRMAIKNDKETLKAWGLIH